MSYKLNLYQFHSRNFKDTDNDMPLDDLRRTNLEMALQYCKEQALDTGERTYVSLNGINIADSRLGLYEKPAA